jgi:hypothetical protein
MTKSKIRRGGPETRINDRMTNDRMKRDAPYAACGFAALLVQPRCETASGLASRFFIRSFVILV